jgi:predicted component of type VI protein secretion system
MNVPAPDAPPQPTHPPEKPLPVAAPTPHQPEDVLKPTARAMGPVLGDGEILNPRQVQFGTALRTPLLHRIYESIKIYRHLAVRILKSFMNAK